MLARAALAAAGVLSLFAAAEPPQAPSELLPARVDRSADNHATIKGLRIMARSLPDSSAKQQVLPVLTRIDEGASRLPPPKREAYVTQSLPELTVLAGRLSPDAVPKEVLKQVQNNAAYLNNRANRWEDAARLSDQVLAVAPQDRDALLNRSNAAYGLKNYKNAYEDADRAVKLDPNDPDGYTARALAAYGPTTAAKIGEDALALNSYAWFWAQQGTNLESALAAAQRSPRATRRLPQSGGSPAHARSRPSAWSGRCRQVQPWRRGV